MGTNTMYVHHVGHAASTYTHTHTPWQTLYLSNDGAHYTYTNSCTLHARCELVLCTYTCIQFYRTARMHV